VKAERIGGEREVTLLCIPEQAFRECRFGEHCHQPKHSWIPEQAFRECSSGEPCYQPKH
jgi:hypothetical protein